MQTIGDGGVLEILLYVAPTQLAAIERTCKQFYRLLAQPVVWKSWCNLFQGTTELGSRLEYKITSIVLDRNRNLSVETNEELIEYINQVAPISLYLKCMNQKIYGACITCAYKDPYSGQVEIDVKCSGCESSGESKNQGFTSHQERNMANIARWMIADKYPQLIPDRIRPWDMFYLADDDSSLAELVPFKNRKHSHVHREKLKAEKRKVEEYSRLKARKLRKVREGFGYTDPVYDC